MGALTTFDGFAPAFIIYAGEFIQSAEAPVALHTKPRLRSLGGALALRLACLLLPIR